MSQTLLVQKSPAPHGMIRVPGDKSISHRALIFAALAQGKSKIRHILPSEDVYRTAAILRALGVTIEDSDDGPWIIHGVGLHGLKPPAQDLYCGNSGTTLRLMTGLLAAQPFASRLTGDDSLDRRPMDRVILPLRQMGAEVRETRKNGKRRIEIQGGESLRPIDYHSPQASAQVKSAILLAGLYAQGPVKVHEPIKSRDHTERLMQSLGLDLAIASTQVTLKPGGAWKGRSWTIPGDFSSAAFPLVATLIHPDPQASVVLREVGLNPTRIGLLEVLRDMGASINISAEKEVGGEPVAQLRVRSSRLQCLALTQEKIPSLIDEIPIFAVAAASAQGQTKIRGAKELRVKETDRLRAITTELGKLGIPIQEFEDGLDIEGTSHWHGAHCSSHGDHRIAMALAVAGSIAEGPVRIEAIECIQTSFPNFVSLMGELGTRLEVLTT